MTHNCSLVLHTCRSHVLSRLERLGRYQCQPSNQQEAQPLHLQVQSRIEYQRCRALECAYRNMHMHMLETLLPTFPPLSFRLNYNVHVRTNYRVLCTQPTHTLLCSSSTRRQDPEALQHDWSQTCRDVVARPRDPLSHPCLMTHSDKQLTCPSNDDHIKMQRQHNKHRTQRLRANCSNLAPLTL